MNAATHQQQHTSSDRHAAAERSSVRGHMPGGPASFPAVSTPAVAQRQPAPHTSALPAQMTAGPVIQRYTIGTIDDVDYQFSENIDMGVSVNDEQLFHAGPDVPTAPNVLKLDHTFEESGNRIFSMNVGYIQDCGFYANDLLYKINTYDKKTHKRSLKTYLQDSPKPGIGEAFYMVSDDSDPEKGKKHFNHHYGVVVAKSGNDVVTAEADSTKPKMAFHMYNNAKFGQSFKDVYVTKGKLAQSAKEYLMRIEITAKE